MSDGGGFMGIMMVGMGVILIASITLMGYSIFSEDCTDSWDVPLCNKVLWQLQAMFVFSLVSGGVFIVLGILSLLSSR